MNKNVQLYASDEVLEEFYSALADSNGPRLRRIHIPRSDVFYVRAAIEADTGVKYSLDHVERAMYLEGHLSRRDVLDPDRKRPYADNPTEED
jgi:hypothetical protein|tara:strand:- start:168 stop:443 length:276 start_codon:yes stop_codon:yes gene_type:complete